MKKYYKDCEESENCEKIIKQPGIQKVPLNPGVYGTTCLICCITCLKNCTNGDPDQKKYLPIMDSNGNCTVCPRKCPWYEHKNRPYILVDELVEKEILLKDLEKKYYESKNKITLCEHKIKTQESELEKKTVEFYSIEDEIRNYIIKFKIEELCIDIDENNQEFINHMLRECRNLDEFKKYYNNWKLNPIEGENSNLIFDHDHEHVCFVF